MKVQYIRAGRFLYAVNDNGPADKQEFPSKSAARRAVRALRLPLGAVRKFDSLVREAGDRNVEVLLTQGRNY